MTPNEARKLNVGDLVLLEDKVDAPVFEVVRVMRDSDNILLVEQQRRIGDSRYFPRKAIFCHEIYRKVDQPHGVVINDLAPGDFVRHVGGGRATFQVLANYGGRATAVAVADITNADEWELVSKVQVRT